jgi:tRNA threonylcarbamoyl adenosine modification protein YeaZ
MISLFIDTHDKDINLVIYKNDMILDKNIKESERHHSDFIMPMLKELLDRNNLSVHDINEIYVVNGPGSFTGVRLGVTIAKTLAFTLNVPIKTITSLEMYAISEDTNEDKIVVIEDLKGVFGAKFDKDNNIVDEYFYKSNDEYKSYLENQDKYVIVNNNIDFNKVYEFMKTKEEITPHKVNPIYIKMIEANKNDKGSVEPRYQ